MTNRSSVARQRAVPIAALPALPAKRVNMQARSYHPMAFQRANPVYAFARRGGPQYDGFGGFSLKKIVKNVGKAVGKAVKDTGHAVGKAATSTVGKAVIGGALALTGVGLPAAAGIMSATQAGGQLIKPGGNLGKAAKGAAEGAVEGAAANVVGRVLPKIPGVGSKVIGLRQRIGTAPKPAPTYESDSRLDALASGQIPDVGVLPSTVSTPMPVLKATPGIFDSVANADNAVALAKRRGAQVLREGVAKQTELEQQAGAATAAANAAAAANDKSAADRLRRKAQDILKKANAAKKAAEAAAAVANTVTPPSANPVAPQGGYPVPADSPSDSGTVVAPDQAGMVGGISPALLIGGAALLLLANRGK